MWAREQFAVKGYFDTRLPGQSYFGAEPMALALNGDGSRLYVANMASDAVAVIDTEQADGEGRRATGWWSRSDLFPRSGCRFSMAFLPSADRRKALRGDGKGEGNRAEQHAAAR